MPSLSTRLLKKFPIDTPIVLAPMAAASGAELALACADAGALGLIGGGYADKEWVADQYSRAFDSSNARLWPRLGIGFITWRLALDASALDWVLDQQQQPAAIMLSFGDARPFANRIKTRGIPLICQIQRIEQVQQAVDLGADVIVAQGGEAGGHGMSSLWARSTMTLVPEVADYLTHHHPETLLLAAGGIADGRGVAAALMLGADGVLMGSRLWASSQCLAPDAAKAESVKANGDQTARSSVFDILRRLPWPAPYDFRSLRNSLHQQWEHQVNVLRQNPEKACADYDEGVAEQDYRRAHVTVGESTGLIHDVPDARTLIARITNQARQCLGG